MSDLVGDTAIGSFFFFGIAFTFLLVALLAGERWAYYPAAALVFVGLLALLTLGSIANCVWAILLIGAGGYLVYRSFRRA